MSLASFPAKFKLINSLVSLHSRINIEDMDGKELGSFHKATLSIGDCFKLENEAGDTLAECNKSVVSWGDEYEITNKENSDVYTIKKQTLDSAASIGEVFTLEKNGAQVAEVKKSDFLTSEKIMIHAPDAPEIWIGTVKKSWHSIRDTWKVTKKEGNNVDSWVLGFFGAIAQID